MSKKFIIILGVVIFLILSASGYYMYKLAYIKTGSAVLTPDKLLSSFIITNPNLSPEAVQLFEQRFDETKKRLQASPDEFGDWLYVGVLKKGIGNYEGSRDAFIYAGNLRPQSSTPFANLADLYAYFLNDPVKAEENIKKAIANDPNDYNLYLSLADIYRYKFPERIGAYEKVLLEAMAKFADNPNLIAPLAAYYRDTNQTQPAIEWYERLVKLDSNNVAAKQDLEELKAK